MRFPNKEDIDNRHISENERIRIAENIRKGMLTGGMRGSFSKWKIEFFGSLPLTRKDAINLGR